jgi:hypothetical protein
MKKLNNRTEEALTGLEIAIREINANERREGEFTIDDFVLELSSNGQLISYDAAGKRLANMAKKGLLRFRLIPLNGSHTRVYSKP